VVERLWRVPGGEGDDFVVGEQARKYAHQSGAVTTDTTRRGLKELFDIDRDAHEPGQA
jgi:hypothetical protein